MLKEDQMDNVTYLTKEEKKDLLEKIETKIFGKLLTDEEKEESKLRIEKWKDSIKRQNHWKAYKHKLANKLADDQYDLRIAEALRNRFV